MNEFDQIIGYASIKKDLEQITDVLRNKEVYSRLGVLTPKGLLLYGEPGVGKTLMATCLINASNREVFTCRKDQPSGDFVKTIKAVFSKALENTPSIVFLDDMDKFANGDEEHRDAEEYVTVQSCIDEMKDAEVFVVATANYLRCLPSSLLRAGRFDRIIEVAAPSGRDAVRIIDHYIKNKKFVADIDADFIARIMNERSCAELETVINEAGLYAGFERAESITVDHFIKACLRTIFDIPAESFDEENRFTNLCDIDSTKTQIVYHEAGHAVVSEILNPGSVTLVTAHNCRGESEGFTSYYREEGKNPLKWIESRVVSALGGKAALEHKFGFADVGTTSDLDQAFRMTKDLVTNNCICGFHLHANGYDDSDSLKTRQEQAVATEVEQYFRKAKGIISFNNELFERIAVNLAEKGILTMIDIQKIKSECILISL